MKASYRSTISDMAACDVKLRAVPPREEGEEARERVVNTD